MADSQLSKFLSQAGERPYRDLVEHHIKKQTHHQLQKAVLGEVALLPEGWADLAESWIDRVNKQFGYDKKFWETATCEEAFHAVLGIATDHFRHRGLIDSAEDALLPQNHEQAFGLFQIATLSFAYSAALEPKQREFMGIGKGRSTGILRHALLGGIIGLVVLGVAFLFGEAVANYAAAIILGGLVVLVVWRFFAARKQAPRSSSTIEPSTSRGSRCPLRSALKTS